MWPQISKNKISQYKKFASKKNRLETGLFLAEGTKCVLDTLNHFTVEAIIATHDWLEKYSLYLPEIDNIYYADKSQLEKISSLSTSSDVVAVYKIPESKLCDEDINGELVLVLDCVQDPGNLGTIIRIADWFGIKTIIASPDTVDVYNPKTIQATMGSISRVKVCYADIKEVLTSHPDVPAYGTFLNGENIYDSPLHAEAFIIMGNEGSGISNEVRCLIKNRLTIPTFQTSADKPESLNVGMATAIIVSEFKRRN